MKSLRTVLAASLLSSIFSVAGLASASEAPGGAVLAKVTATQAAERDLWVGHIFWVREVVRGLAEKNQAAADFAEKQVVANAKQLAGAIEPFYGKAASDQLFKLLAGHYTAVKAHATATVAGDAAGAKKAIADLTANANEIAKFLSGANPNLPEATLKSLLAAHGGHHVQQNQQFAAHDMAGEARTWEAMKSHIYTLADALIGGIAKQFPDKFQQ
ncbi:MAG TPA: hypothetical protein VJT10_22245 [Steroidobacteraceae bacterium]|nr:hypothetical protein [Steroidobacteraceae bacterium]